MLSIQAEKVVLTQAMADNFDEQNAARRSQLLQEDERMSFDDPDPEMSVDPVSCGTIHRCGRWE